MKTLNIAQISSTFPPYQAGIGNVCFNLSRELTNIGHRVTVFTSSAIGDQTISRYGFTTQHLPTYLRIGNAGLTPQLVKVLRGFDVIHLHYPFFGGDIFTTIASYRYRTPYVLTYHQDPSADSLFRKILMNVYQKVFEQRVVSSASRILALSQDHYSQSNLMRYKLPAGKVSIIPNGVDLSLIDSNTETIALREKYKIPNSKVIIMFVAALDKAHFFKNLELLLETMAGITNTSHLIVIGDGDMRNYYEAKAEQYGVKNNVSFLGKKSNIETIAHIKESDMLILPSKQTESFGIVLTEAMATGKPVIASDIPGVRSVVKNQRSGLLFKNQDSKDLLTKIETLINNPELRKKMGLEGRREVEKHYSWRIITQEVESVYLEVCSSKKP